MDTPCREAFATSRGKIEVRDLIRADGLPTMIGRTRALPRNASTQVRKRTVSLP